MQPQIILQLILVAAYIGVFIYQFNAIKIINTKFDVLDRFQNIIDVEKFEKYADFLQKNADLDKELFKKQIVTEESKAYFSKHAQLIPNIMRDRHVEAINFICEFLQSAEDSESVETILSLLPENRSILERMLIHRNTKTPSNGDSAPGDLSGI